MQRAALAPEKEYTSAIKRADKPEQGICQINPNGILHALDIVVAICVHADVHIAKQAEECDPQNARTECQLRSRPSFIHTYKTTRSQGNSRNVLKKGTMNTRDVSAAMAPTTSA